MIALTCPYEVGAIVGREACSASSRPVLPRVGAALAARRESDAGHDLPDLFKVPRCGSSLRPGDLGAGGEGSGRGCSSDSSPLSQVNHSAHGLPLVSSSSRKRMNDMRSIACVQILFAKNAKARAA